MPKAFASFTTRCRPARDAQRHRYAGHFPPVYDAAARRIVALIEQALPAGLEAESAMRVDLVHAIHDGRVAAERLALDRGVSETTEGENGRPRRRSPAA